MTREGVLARRPGTQGPLQPGLVGRRGALRCAGDGSGQATGARGDFQRRTLHGRRHRRRQAPAVTRRSDVRARHVQRVGHPHPLEPGQIVQPARVPPRECMGCRERDDRVRPTPISGSTRARWSSREPCSISPRSIPSTGSRSAWAAMPAVSDRYLSIRARQRTPALERERLRTPCPLHRRAPAGCAARSPSPRSRLADVAAGDYHPRPAVGGREGDDPVLAR